MTMILYSASRATAPYRVRIGLKLKGLDYDYVGIDLLGGEQHKPAYRAINRQRLTPALDLGDGDVMTQSLAILECLDAPLGLLPAPERAVGAILQHDSRLGELGAHDVGGGKILASPGPGPDSRHGPCDRL